MSDNYAVIGNPIQQSKSPIIHGAFAAATAQDMVYTKVEAPTEPGGFARTVDALRAQGLKGMNITAPFKLDAFAYATDLTDRARRAGAVNAMKFEGGKAYADNFDGLGLVRDIVHNLHVAVKGKRILVLGAGGAVRGALQPFLDEGPQELVIANMHVDKAQALAQQYAKAGNIRASTYEALSDAGHFDLVLNATSASLFGQLPPVPASVFASHTLAYELAYGKGLTPFLRHAQAAGATRLADGVGMLAEQAAEAFLWWRGVRPDTQAVIAQITVPLV
jgi:shikimate dehydrogenase